MTRYSPTSFYTSRALAAVGVSCLFASLSGCGLGSAGSVDPISPAAAPVASITGKVHGGNQPVVGAKIQLYVAGVTAPAGSLTGYGAGATPLGPSTTTDSTGSFSITGTYTCPATTQQAYLVATGGDSGSGVNANLAEMSALGPCPAGGTLVATVPFVVISEVSTVSAVWALQQFMAPPAAANALQPNIGAPNTSYANATANIQSAVLGMNNAFVTAKVMADPATGYTPNTNYPYATPESAKINTIADILAYCVNSNSTGTSAAPVPSTQCSNLFAAATPTGKPAATDTIQAAWYMARNPINNIGTLYGFVASAGAPFQPTQLAPGTQNTTSTGIATNSFNDTTIAINYAPATAGVSTVAAAYAVAIDAYGNAWLSNAGGAGGAVANISALGVDGNTLVAPITTFTASVTSGGATQFTAPPPAVRMVTAPKGVAVDLNNSTWVANNDTAPGVTAAGTVNAASVAVVTGATAPGMNGTPIVPVATGYFTGLTPYGVAIDSNNNAFIANTATSGPTVLNGRSISKIAPDGTYTVSTTGATTLQNSLPGGAALLAIDANTTPIVYSAGYNGCKVQGQYNATTPFGLIGEFLTSTDMPLSGSGIVSAYSNQAPGPGSATNCGSTSQFVGQTVTAAIANPFGIAVDRTNSVWVSDQFTSSLGFDGLTYLATPNPTSGTVASSTFLSNGVFPTASTAPQGGTTISKSGAIFVDGNNNLWLANQSKGSIVEASLVNGGIVLDTPGQGSNLGTGAAYGIGFQHNQGNSTGLAIDASGNVWVTNLSTSGTYTNQQGVATALVGNSVTVVVGAAGPVVTPISLAIKANRLGQKP